MLFTPIDASAVVGGRTPRLSTEKDCILTEYLAWHAGATFVYNYGLSCTTVQVHANSCIIECPIVFTSERIYSKWYAIVGHSALAQSCLADIIVGSSEQPFLCSSDSSSFYTFSPFHASGAIFFIHLNWYTLLTLSLRLLVIKC